MIKYHILALLCLVAAAISAIEFLAISIENPEYITAFNFWLMILVFAFSVMLYLRTRRFRKESFKNQQR